MFVRSTQNDDDIAVGFCFADIRSKYGHSATATYNHGLAVFHSVLNALTVPQENRIRSVATISSAPRSFAACF